ncbi:MAG: BamA/TamA family outer membrane protein [Bacteroidales bacterium]
MSKQSSFSPGKARFRDLWSGLLAGVLLTLAPGCSNTRFLPEGEEMYTGIKKIEVIRTKEETSYNISTNLMVRSLLSTPPTSPLMGTRLRSPLPIRLWIYNYCDSGREKGIAGWFRRQFGLAPVLISQVNPVARAAKLQNELYNNGHFRSTVSFTRHPAKLNPKKVKIGYQVHLTPPYTLHAITSPLPTTPIDSIIQVTRRRSQLKEGEPYRLSLLSEERTRITTYLQNRGYYYFRPEYLEFLADTTLYPKQVELALIRKTNMPAKAALPWTIDSISFTFDNERALPLKRFHYKEMDIYYKGKLPVRPDLIYSAIRLKQKDPYRINTHYLTQSKLNQLGLFSYTNIQLTEEKTDSLSLLSVKINAAEKLAVEAFAEVGVSTLSNNFMGPGLSLGFTQYNLFKGGERLSVEANGSYEWQMGGGGGEQINSQAYSLSGRLHIPRISFAGRKFKRPTDDPATIIQSGVNFLRRGGYFDMLGIEGGLTYEWRFTADALHAFTPVRLSYSRISHTSESFRQASIDNPSIALSFKNQFIPSLQYSYTLDQTNRRRLTNRLYWQARFTSAGNLLNGAQRLLGASQKNDNNQYTLFGDPYTQFLKLSSDLRFYRRLSTTSLLVARLFAGVGFSYGNSRVMPYSEQFYSAGPNSIRGFVIRSIGPGSFHPAGDNSRAYLDQTGDFKLEMNLEYRFRMSSGLNGAIFADAGNIFLLRNDANRPGATLTLRELGKAVAVSTGFGLRYDITYLVLRGDIGVPLHAPYRVEGNSSYFNVPNFLKGLVYHITIGYPF